MPTKLTKKVKWRDPEWGRGCDYALRVKKRRRHRELRNQTRKQMALADRIRANKGER